MYKEYKNALKEHETVLAEIDRYTWIGVYGCANRIKSDRNQVKWAENLIYEMEEEAEEAKEIITSTAEEITEALNLWYEYNYAYGEGL